MAYVSKETKQSLAPAIKAILKKYGMKGTISVEHHSTLRVTISSGKLDIFGNHTKPHDENYISYVNCHWLKENFTDPTIVNFLSELHAAMNVGNYNNSDIMRDYFDVGFYTTISIGRWNKPYILIKE